LNDELAAFYDKREIKLSLKTSNLSEATQKRSQLVLNIDAKKYGKK